jgi:phage antirepressor YoqD-like protein
MYSNLVKNKAIVHYKYFLKSLKKVASIYKIGKSTLSRWLKNDGVVVKRKQNSSILYKINDLIEDKLLVNIELTKLVKDELKLNVSKTSCWRSLRLKNFSRKKRA